MILSSERARQAHDLILPGDIVLYADGQRSTADRLIGWTVEQIKDWSENMIELGKLKPPKIIAILFSVE